MPPAQKDFYFYKEMILKPKVLGDLLGEEQEIQEEVGLTPKFKKVIPLELFTSNDQKFYFHTYVVAIESEFLPKLNGEHSGYCWTAFESWPKNLHAGLRNTLNNKSIKGKLQTILDLIT